jgi:transposase InsO family protein
LEGGKVMFQPLADRPITAAQTVRHSTAAAFQQIGVQRFEALERRDWYEEVPSRTLRHDHGSPFMADHFQNQIKFWGMTPSFAFVGEPQTNGVAERFFRTFKEQVVYGRIYQTIDDVRTAVRVFFKCYNAEWLIEKNGLRSPHHTRIAWEKARMKQAA